MIENVELADMVRLREVFHYILAEALKVTPETGCIYLDMHRTMSGDLEIVLSCGAAWQPDLTFALAITSLHGGQIVLNSQSEK